MHICTEVGPWSAIFSMLKSFLLVFVNWSDDFHQYLITGDTHSSLADTIDKIMTLCDTLWEEGRNVSEFLKVLDDFMHVSMPFTMFLSSYKRSIGRLISIQKLSYNRCYLLQIRQKCVLQIYAGANTPLKKDFARYSCSKTMSCSKNHNSIYPDLINPLAAMASQFPCADSIYCNFM